MLKKSVLVLALVLGALSAQADSSFYSCKQNEAEFIGSATDVKGCTFKINFSFYQESGVCPLDQVEAARVVFTADAEDCKKLVEGAPVSGILVEKDGKVFIE